MQTDILNRWLSLVANVGVMLGLVLVAFQIRQDVELTKIQLFSDAPFRSTAKVARII